MNMMGRSNCKITWREAEKLINRTENIVKDIYSLTTPKSKHDIAKRQRADSLYTKSVELQKNIFKVIQDLEATRATLKKTDEDCKKMAIMLASATSHPFITVNAVAVPPTDSSFHASPDPSPSCRASGPNEPGDA